MDMTLDIALRNRLQLAEYDAAPRTRRATPSLVELYPFVMVENRDSSKLDV
jgi:hypothetical protein